MKHLLAITCLCLSANSAWASEDLDCQLDTSVGRRWLSMNDTLGEQHQEQANEFNVAVYCGPVTLPFAIGPTYTYQRFIDKKEQGVDTNINFQKLGFEAIAWWPLPLVSPYAKLRYLWYSRGHTRTKVQDQTSDGKTETDTIVADHETQGYQLGLGALWELTNIFYLTTELNLGFEKLRVRRSKINGQAEDLSNAHKTTLDSTAILLGMNISL